MHLMTKAEKTEFLTASGHAPGSSDFKYYMGGFDFIETGAGEVLKLKKPGIKTTIWYDDEQPDPSRECGLEALFMAENASEFFDWQLSGWKESRDELERTGACAGGWRKAPGIVLEPHTGTYRVAARKETWGREDETARDLSGDEVDELLGILDELRGAYEKRLATYWKRYEHKVRCSGYWRNR